mgnify:CR=1 FL=1
MRRGKLKSIQTTDGGGNGGIMTDNAFRRKYEFALSKARQIVDRQAGFLASSIKDLRTKRTFDYTI